MITLGSARPVRFLIPATCSAVVIRSASACLRVLGVALRVGLEALEVEAQGGAGGAGAGEAEDDARAVGEQDADALVLC